MFNGTCLYVIVRNVYLIVHNTQCIFNSTQFIFDSTQIYQIEHIFNQLW
jgi:hypothetical protein